jgi:hypothetical protein
MRKFEKALFTLMGSDNSKRCAGDRVGNIGTETPGGRSERSNPGALDLHKDHSELGDSGSAAENRRVNESVSGDGGKEVHNRSVGMPITEHRDRPEKPGYDEANDLNESDERSERESQAVNERNDVVGELGAGFKSLPRFERDRVDTLERKLLDDHELATSRMSVKYGNDNVDSQPAEGHWYVGDERADDRELPVLSGADEDIPGNTMPPSWRVEDETDLLSAD